MRTSCESARTSLRVACFRLLLCEGAFADGAGTSRSQRGCDGLTRANGHIDAIEKRERGGAGVVRTVRESGVNRALKLAEASEGGVEDW